MRIPIIAGILLVAIGAFIVFQGLSFHSQGSFSVGPIHGTVHERHTIPVLFGWVAIVGGALLTVAVRRGKRR